MSTTNEPAQCHNRPTPAHDVPSQNARPRVAADPKSTGDRVAPVGPGGATVAESLDETAFVEDWVI
jgi:hypothetical protein